MIYLKTQCLFKVPQFEKIRLFNGILIDTAVDGIYKMHRQ